MKATYSFVTTFPRLLANQVLFTLGASLRNIHYSQQPESNEVTVYHNIQMIRFLH